MNWNLHVILHMHLRRLIFVTSLGVGLIAPAGGVSAQEDGAPTINADGNSVTSNAGLNPAADADGPTLVYGDLNPGSGATVYGPPAAAPVSTDVVPVPAPGTSQDLTATDGNASTLGPGNASAAPGTVTHDGSSGMSLLGPDGTYSVSEVTPSNVSLGDAGVAAPIYEPAPVYEPVYEPAPEYVAETVETAAPVAADTAVATETDLDGDNYPDALEWEIGLDGNNPDTDGDGVADGDEVNIYGTDPLSWDSDGDGVSDGEELFGILTDPLLWDTNGDGAGDGETAVA